MESFLDAWTGVQLNVVHSKGETFADRAVFIVPYISQGESRLNVLYGGVVPFTTISRKGRYASGSVGLHHTIKDVPVRSKEDVQRQADGYLSLAHLTEEGGSPISVIQVENPLGLPIEYVAKFALEGYKSLHGDQNSDRFETWRGAAEAAAMKTHFNMRTLSGWRRRIFNRTVTAYNISLDDEITREAVEFNHSKGIETGTRMDIGSYV